MRHLFKSLSMVGLLVTQLGFATTIPATILEIKNKTINVNGRTAQVYTIEQPNGTWGYWGVKGQYFNTVVKNETQVPSTIHWHGLLLPNDQDGVAIITQPLIMPGNEYHYHYPLVQSGTYFMHSHVGFQHQEQMAAPYIITDPHDCYRSNQDVVVMFQDFTFRDPMVIFQKLQSTPMNMNMKDMSDMGGMKNMKDMSGMSDMPAMGLMKPTAPEMADILQKITTFMTPVLDTNVEQPKQPPVKPKPSMPLMLNDVSYDAFLTNYHTLKDPEIVQVKPGSVVRLRFINSGAASNFWIKLGKLTGQAIAVDGWEIKPLPGRTFQLAIAQRMDILVKIPKSGGAFPILGQAEGTKRQTGLILVTAGAKVPQINETVANMAPALNYQQELKMKSLYPLVSRPIQRIVMLDLTGQDEGYVWKINGQVWPHIKPIVLKQGERVELIMNNYTNMAHPMHLHGNVFELIGIDKKKIVDGPLHDTFLVMPYTQARMIVDVNTPGKWLLHCHVSYHMAAGMMALVVVEPAITPNTPSTHTPNPTPSLPLAHRR